MFFSMTRDGGGDGGEGSPHSGPNVPAKGNVQTADRGTLGTDPALLGELAHPDRALRERAWRRFDRLYTPLLISWARNLGHRGQDVEDLVQEVKTVFLGKAATFEYDPAQRFRGLLKAILSNKGAELARRRRRNAAEGLGDLPAAEFDLDAAWRMEALREAISVVGAEYRHNPRRNLVTFRAFELRVLEGRTGQEAAAELGIQRSAVDKYKSRVAAEIAEVVRQISDVYG
jgi:RNA polymerase sigma factor (sigma-70 family)